MGPVTGPDAPKRGRPQTKPRMFNVAERAVAAFQEQDAIIAEALVRRDEAFVLMIQSGMTVYQMARATGWGDGSVRWHAKRVGHRPRRVDMRATRTETVVEQVMRKGSILFGD